MISPVKRVPEPMSDSPSHKFAYLHIKDTPSHKENETKPLNDFNTRVKLKEAFENCNIKVDNDEQIEKFFKNFIVDQDMVISSLEDLQKREFGKNVRQEGIKSRKKLKKANHTMIIIGKN